jgi:hypothetical protein
MSVQIRRVGEIQTLDHARNAIRDLESMVLGLIREAATTEDPAPASGIQFLVRETDGTYHLWTLVAGAGVTLTLNSGTRTATITSP